MDLPWSLTISFYKPVAALRHERQTNVFLQTGSRSAAKAKFISIVSEESYGETYL